MQGSDFYIPLSHNCGMQDKSQLPTWIDEIGETSSPARKPKNGREPWQELGRFA